MQTARKPAAPTKVEVAGIPHDERSVPPARRPLTIVHTGSRAIVDVASGAGSAVAAPSGCTSCRRRTGNKDLDHA